MYQRYHPAIFDRAGQNLYQFVAVHPVEELLQTYTIAVTLVCIPQNSMQCIVSTAVRTEAEAIVTELRFIERHQHQTNCLLDKAVYNGQYTQRTSRAFVFRDVYPAQWGRTILSTAYLAQQFLFMEFKVWQQFVPILSEPPAPPFLTTWRYATFKFEGLRMSSNKLFPANCTSTR